MGCSSSIKDAETKDDGDRADNERPGTYKQTNHHSQNEDEDISCRNDDHNDNESHGEPRRKSMTEEEFKAVLEATKEKFQKEMRIMNGCKDYSAETVALSLHRISACLYDIHERKRRHCLGDELASLGFAELFVKIWTSLHKLDLFAKENLQAMKCLKKLKVIAWNYSDLSGVFGKAMGCSGAINLLLTDLVNPKLDVPTLRSNEKRYLIKGTLGILHNCIRMCPENRNLYRSANAVALLNKYQSSSYPNVKCKALLCLSYIIDEQENEQLNAGPGNLQFIIGLLESALQSPSHISKNYRFSASEIVNGLNHFAIHDTNKVMIVENGALPLYVTMLQSNCTEQEQILTARGIWTLAFPPANKHKIKNEEGCLQALTSLKLKTLNSELFSVCCGALWELQQGERSSDADEEDRNERKISLDSRAHVMISYQWDLQARVIKLRDTLREDGYKVWMNVEKMDGDIIEMADAIEKAGAVIICMSQRYKDDPMSRSEATYACKLLKPIIPLMMEPHCIPDGWPAVLLGAIPYFNFHSDDLLATETQKVKEKLQQYGVLQNDKGEGDV
ncbi:uncharacterized protein [Ptychodera flava]|uniref:uncharacterized protein n=1 Tax=Ptychodera flava TaxID=63121 RepID=UPI00396A2B28